MWIWRRLEKTSWTEHITNEEVLAEIAGERVMIHTIRKRQRRNFGDRLEENSLLRAVIEVKT